MRQSALPPFGFKTASPLDQTDILREAILWNRGTVEPIIPGCQSRYAVPFIIKTGPNIKDKTDWRSRRRRKSKELLSYAQRNQCCLLTAVIALKFHMKYKNPALTGSRRKISLVSPKRNLLYFKIFPHLVE